VWGGDPIGHFDRFQAHNDAITDALYEPTLSLFATSSLDKTVRLYTTSQKKADFKANGSLHGHDRGVRKV
jgi:hypothetical protein